MRLLSAAALSVPVVLALAGCGSTLSAASSAPAATHAAGDPAAASSASAVPVRTTAAAATGASATSADTAGWTFTVSGDLPVPPNDSQATHAATPGAVCVSGVFAKDKAAGQGVAAGFSLAGFPVAASLLEHFLDGQGTAVDYQAGSSISKQAAASSAFLAVDKTVKAQVLAQLKAGARSIKLAAAQLPTVAFESTGSDLYWGFRGTQGLQVTGGGTREGGRFVGTLTYVIRDSYGFPADDTLDGFGPPMRYLQTVCGAPQHAGGAHWFPDTITVTVPFDQPA